MQAVYPSRIDWKDEPSTNTPLGANNLNKMDYALYELDKRVLTLGGYEERAALSATNAETSEINAKTSENNSKVSETNAKTSEINAKDYMERAYATTPEGYDELVETVRLMDIATTTESILEKSKPGGLKINHIKGATEQNGTPTPSSPIGIKNVGDCVEMMNGFRNTTDGKFSTSDLSVCNKTLIPCKSGDVVKVVCEKNHTYIYSVLYNNDIFVKGDYRADVSEYEFTIPSGVTHFGFHISDANGFTLQTVGKISLTVNGKYVTPIKSHGKNFLENVYGDLQAGGVTFKCNANKSLDISGTLTGANNYMFEKGKYLKKGSYIVSGMGGVSANQNGDMLLRVYDATNGKSLADLKYGINEALFTIDKDLDNVNIYINFNTVGVTYSGTIYPMIRKADITDDTYEPYQETTAYIYTDEPIRDSDVVFNDNGVWKVERNSGNVLLDGDDSIALYSDINTFFAVKGLSLMNVADNEKANMYCTHFTTISANEVYLGSQGIAVRGKDLWIRHSSITSLEEFLTWLSENPMEIQYKLATPTYETLDTASQIALNSLKTFDTVTYIEVDSRVQPSEIEVEYGTSKVGGYSLEALRNSKNNEKAIEENMKAITSGEVVVEYESEDDFAGRSWINVVTLMAGKKLKNILNMISAMFNNIRFLRNEVNKKMDANYGYLTEGDLNNIIYESGKAYCTTNVANIPIMGRGWLEVLMSDDADMVLQRYTTAVGNKVFIRRLVKSTSNGWGEWSKCNLTSDDIVVDMVAKPATMNLPAWASVNIEIESKYLSLEYELLSANVYFVDDLSSGTLSDSNLCVDQVMTSTNTASAHCCVAKVRNASSSQINKGCYSVARFVLVKK